MLATVLIVTTLQANGVVGALVVIGVFGYVVTGALLAEPFEGFERSLTPNVSDSAGVRGVLLLPALVAVSQADPILHHPGSIMACFAGLIVGGAWALTVFQDWHDEAGQTMSGYAEILRSLRIESPLAFARTASYGAAGYATAHTLYVVLFLVVIGIPLSIIDIFADVALEDVTGGDLFSLSILMVTAGVLAVSGSALRPMVGLARDAIEAQMAHSHSTRDLLAPLSFLVLSTLPSAAMFWLIAFPQLYFNQLMVPLAEWVFA